jgi:hypothetical protein
MVPSQVYRQSIISIIDKARKAGGRPGDGFQKPELEEHEVMKGMK